MVRPVRVDGEPVSRAAAAFRFSRPSSYAATAALKAGGLLALVPARPGPGRAHKLTSEIVAFAEVADAIAKRFGRWCIPARSNVRWPGPATPRAVADEPARPTLQALVDRYEQLRRHALDGGGQGWRLGLALLHRRGMAGWMRASDGLPAPPPAAGFVPAVAVAPG